MTSGYDPLSGRIHETPVDALPLDWRINRHCGARKAGAYTSTACSAFAFPPSVHHPVADVHCRKFWRTSIGTVRAQHAKTPRSDQDMALAPLHQSTEHDLSGNAFWFYTRQMIDRDAKTAAKDTATQQLWRLHSAIDCCYCRQHSCGDALQQCGFPALLQHASSRTGAQSM